MLKVYSIKKYDWSGLARVVPQSCVNSDILQSPELMQWASTGERHSPNSYKTFIRLDKSYRSYDLFISSYWIAILLYDGTFMGVHLT